MPLHRTLFGSYRGEEVFRFTLERGGLVAEIIGWGATLRSLRVAGTDVDLVLGLERFEEYPAREAYLGATVGRFANRIAGGRFTLDGRTYTLPRNEKGRHTLHGGPDNLARRVWRAESDPEGCAVRLSIFSPDGDQGFPGDLHARCTYRLTEGRVLRIEMEARTDAPTPVNFAHHSYWNLAGSGTIDGHLLSLDADRYLEAGADTIPTGRIAEVAGTRYDFRRPRRLDAAGDADYDNCFVVRGEGFRRVARLEDPSSGRSMELWADQPGVQLYTGFKLDIATSAGRRLGPRAGLCLETENFPNAPNIPHFPNCILRPGETYRHVMEHRFTLPG